MNPPNRSAGQLACAVLLTPVGGLRLSADSEGLRQIEFLRAEDRAPAGAVHSGGDPLLREAARQLSAYFARELENFDLPLAPGGTPFQMEVWKQLQEIPYGETISYLELARRIRRPQACRAVGLANGSNPIPIVIPCHRVIGASGKLVGYGGGLAIKEALLALEHRQRPLALALARAQEEN